MKQSHQIAKEIIEKYKADLLSEDYGTNNYLKDLIVVAITEERARAGKLREALEFYANEEFGGSLGRQALAEYERGE
jgi:hypothetical protein